MSQTFVRRIPRYPRVSLRVSEAPTEAPRLLRRVDARPGRFIVLDPRTGTPDWRIPQQFLEAGEFVGPLQAAVYLARVEDVGSAGECAVMLWEVPNGLMGTATLSAEQMAGLRPRIGDTLRVYTWIEVPKAGMDGFGRERPRIVVEPTPRAAPTAAQRAALRKALAVLEQKETDE